MASTYEPSAAMARTARNEIERIGRALEVVQQRRASLLAQAAELEAEVEDYARRKRLLEELVQVEHATPTAEIGAAPTQATRSLRGRELRRAAGRLLWQWKGESPIHYREWFERVLAAGYATGGKDPAASFLSNVRESPAVIRGSDQGFYALDPSSVHRVAQALSETQAELTDVERSIEQSYAGDPRHGPVEALRAHRGTLKQRLKRMEADLDEVRFVFEEDSAARQEEPAVGPGLRAA